MKKEITEKLILCFAIFVILVTWNLLVFASNANIEINSPEKVNYGESFNVSLEVPTNTYGIEAKVILKYSDGTEESQKLVYIEGMADTENLVTFKANVAGNAEIIFSNIILCDKDSNVIETEKTKTKSIKIERELTSLSLNYQSASIDISKQSSLQLNAIVTPGDSTDLENVTWISSDEAIATVDKNGLVTAKKTGIVNITAKCKEYSAVCSISIISSMTNFSLNKNSLTLYYDKTTNKKSLGTLEAIIQPTNTTDSKVVSWSTSNSSVAIVENGIVTPVGIGTTTIVAKCNNFTVSCEVIVSDKLLNTTLETKNVEDKLVIYSNAKTNSESFLTSENFPVILLNSVKLYNSQGNEKNALSKVGSRDIIKITNETGEILAEYTIIVPGDVNGDGEVKMYDAFTILKGALFKVELSSIDKLIRSYNVDLYKDDLEVKMYDAFCYLKVALFN